MSEQKTPNLVTRNDTLLGVCQALGDDFGFNPTWLRVALILPIFWFPLEMVALYLGLGLVVLASRKLFPARVDRPVVNSEPARIEPEYREAA